MTIMRSGLLMSVAVLTLALSACDENVPAAITPAGSPAPTSPIIRIGTVQVGTPFGNTPATLLTVEFD